MGTNTHKQTPCLTPTLYAVSISRQATEAQSRCWIYQRLIKGFWDNYIHHIALFLQLWGLPRDESTWCVFLVHHVLDINNDVIWHHHYSNLATHKNNQHKTIRGMFVKKHNLLHVIRTIWMSEQEEVDKCCDFLQKTSCSWTRRLALFSPWDTNPFETVKFTTGCWTSMLFGINWL